MLKLLRFLRIVIIEVVMVMRLKFLGVNMCFRIMSDRKVSS